MSITDSGYIGKRVEPYCYKLMNCPLDVASEMTPFSEMRRHGDIDRHEARIRRATYAKRRLYEERSHSLKG
jgi:hypothetical protein